MTSQPVSRAQGPAFWVGMIFLSFAITLFLAVTEAINSTTATILLVAPIGMMVPLFKSATRRVEDGGTACMAKGQAQKRYVKRLMIATSLYLVALAAMKLADKELEMIETVRVVLAVLPGLAVMGMFWAIGRLIVEEQDEFLRMLIIRQALIATGIALSAASVWGFLESADIIIHLDAYWWAVVWFLGFGVGAFVNRLTYGTWGAV